MLYCSTVAVLQSALSTDCPVPAPDLDQPYSDQLDQARPGQTQARQRRDSLHIIRPGKRTLHARGTVPQTVTVTVQCATVQLLIIAAPHCPQ